MKSKVKYAIPVATMLVGAFFARVSISKYVIWYPSKGPGGGFLPMLIGFLMIGVGILDLIQAKKYLDAEFHLSNWFFVICVAVLIAASYIIGLVPAAFIFVFYWLKIKEKCSWKATIITLVFLVTLVSVVFIFWLDTPFKYGVFDQFLK